MAEENLEEILNPIKKYTIGDGYSNILVDLEKSHSVWMKNKLDDKKYLDFMSYYASMPLGYNHPEMIEDLDFMNNLRLASINKIGNPDFYTEQLSSFVDTFAHLGAPENFDKFFFISGGALAVENSLKAAFDWKVRLNFEKGYTGEMGSKIVHFKEAFHGRSGYTMSLTNTADPRKYQYFPKFNWPRITNPKITFPLKDHEDEVIETEEKAMAEINEAFNMNKDDIAAIIIEPIQGEGGDNHFRGEFLRELRLIADEKEAMLIFDEIQTGVGLTGKMWAFEHHSGAEPDLIAFGKKTQVCGFMSNDRIDEVENNVFKESSRINSTWGGSLVDMVRSEKIFNIIDDLELLKQVEKNGKYFTKILSDLDDDHDEISNVRNKGLFAAFDMDGRQQRDNVKKELLEKGLMVLGSGTRSIRFRPPLITKEEHFDEAYNIIDEVMKERSS